MTNQLFKIYFAQHDINKDKNNPELEADFIVYDPFCKRGMIGGERLFSEYTFYADNCGPDCLVYIFIADMRIRIPYNAPGLMMFLQYACGLLLAKGTHDQKYQIQNFGGVHDLDIQVISTDKKVDFSVIPLINDKHVVAWDLIDKTFLLSSGTTTRSLPLIVFVSEIIRVAKSFSNAIITHEEQVIAEAKSSGATNVSVYESEHETTCRYFEGRLTKEELEKVQFRWYDLEQLFADHLKKEGLAMQDVEQIIQEEEKRWREKNPGKQLAADMALGGQEDKTEADTDNNMFTRIKNNIQNITGGLFLLVALLLPLNAVNAEDILLNPSTKETDEESHVSYLLAQVEQLKEVLERIQGAPSEVVYDSGEGWSIEYSYRIDYAITKRAGQDEHGEFSRGLKLLDRPAFRAFWDNTFEVGKRKLLDSSTYATTKDKFAVQSGTLNLSVPKIGESRVLHGIYGNVNANGLWRGEGLHSQRVLDAYTQSGVVEGYVVTGYKQASGVSEALISYSDEFGAIQQQTKTFFPRSWTDEDIMSAAAEAAEGATGSFSTVVTRRGHPVRIIGNINQGGINQFFPALE